MSFVRDAGSVVATAAIGIPVGLVTNIVLARWLSLEDRGLYALLTGFAAVAFLLSELGWSTSIVYRVRRMGVAPARAATTGLAGTLVAGALVLGLCAALREPLTQRFLDGAAAPFFWLTLCSVPFLLIGEFARGIARALDRFDLFNWYSFLQGALLLAALLVLLVGAGGALLEALEAQLLVQAGLGLWLLVLMLRSTGAELRPDATEARESLRFGFQAYLNTISTRLHDQLDLFLIAWLLPGSADVAFFAIASGTFARLALVPTSLAIALFPKLASASDAEAARFSLFVTRHALYLTLAVAALLAPAAPLLLPLLYGADYSASVLPFLLLLPGIAGLTSSRLLGRYFLVSDRQGLLIAVRTAALALNVALNLVLLGPLGIAGAAVAKLTSQSAEGALIAAAFFRATGARPTELLPQAGDVDPYRRRLAGLLLRIRGASAR